MSSDDPLSGLVPLISNALRLLSCSLPLKVQANRVHTHRKLINTLPQAFFAWPRRKLCNNSMCNNASNASPHRSVRGASPGTSSKLEWRCWHPHRLLWLYHIWKRATRCSRVSALRATFAVNTAIIPDSLRLSHEMWAHLEAESEEEPRSMPDVREGEN